MRMVSFDICAIILLIFLMFSIISRKITSGSQGRFLMLLTVVTFISALFDIWGLICDAYPDPRVVSTPIRYISQTGYLIFHNLTSLSFILYLISLTDRWHKIIHSNLLKLCAAVPYAILAVLLALNPINHLMFYFDERNKYTRGKLFFILYVVAGTVMAVGLIYVIIHRKLFTAGKFAALLMIVPIQLIAVIIQMVNKELVVEMFFNAISVLLITITVQRPEEIIDSTTGLRRYSAYTTDMKRNFYNEKKVSVILINIANYTNLFGIAGYDASNEILVKVAEVLKDVNRELKARADIYYLDRGRFRLVVNENNRDKIEEAAKMINHTLKTSMMINGMELNLIAYVCIGKCPEEITDFKSLMAFGNDFHVLNPYSGRVMYTSEIAEKNHFQLTNELDSIIDSALANRRFEVYYQPIYSVEKKKFISAEALLRLKDDKYGFISPDVFIVAAERSGAIHKIGDYVMEEVCRFISGPDFRNLGLDYIEINLSVAQCMQSDLADKVLKIMKRFGVTADKINLEITETALNYSQHIMTENINKLTNAGISFSLDDYGTGYSNIRSVASLPLTIVKLDKSFVDEEDNPRMSIVLQNTIKMLKDMDMHIIIEGVETEQFVKVFSDLNCDYIQGYYFSKPIPEQEFIRFMYNAVSAS